MDKQLLSEITVFNKYAKFLDELGRRENYAEIVDRNKTMHQTKYPQLAERIENIYRDFVHTKRVLPSMRSMQFGGRPILLAENRIYNCAYAPIESSKFFSELMFLLLGGTGMGYSVQRRHTEQLPKVKAPESDQEYKFQIQDSIIGWADSIKVVVKAFLKAGTLPVFDYRDIREKGTDLVTTGGKAPGPEPLRKCIDTIIPIFRQAIGRRLTPLEAHDIACCIADSVRAGGIRRAAMIALFDRNDGEMLTCKAGVTVKTWRMCPTQFGQPPKVEWVDCYGITGQAEFKDFELEALLSTGKLPWYYVHPYRARANNSVVLPRGKVSEQEFRALLQVVEASGCGEPGIYWTNNEDWGTNPCCLAGDAQILTAEGYAPISSLDDGQEHTFVNVAGDVVRGTVWRTGEKRVLRIKAGMTKEPIQIRATADHRFMTAEGDTVEAKDLKGKHLMPFVDPVLGYSIEPPLVFSVSEEGIEPVYDFNLQDDTHWGVVEGVIAHNCEIGMRPYQMCNLTTINVSAITSQTDFNLAAGAAAFLGTLQAGYTDFHYLNPKWKKACEKEALLGVSMTGIASGNIDQLDKTEAAEFAAVVNEQLATDLGINIAARITTVKPEGTSSLVLGTSSGIHAWHGEYYIRRMRAGKDEALAQYLMDAAPGLVEQDVTDTNQVVLSFPQKAPDGAVTRHESMLDLLERVKAISEEWVAAGHRSGDNYHNVSCTISVKDDEWKPLADWMWGNRDCYNGISVMPYYGSSSYPQMPFEDITREQYEAMLPLLEGIDIGQVFEDDGSAIDLKAEPACAGGVCELTY